MQNLVLQNQKYNNSKKDIGYFFSKRYIWQKEIFDEQIHTCKLFVAKSKVQKSDIG